ncbi:MAG: LemA family protein [Candidatus Aureabacteria bacterium]|jgi:LemA protein|nr:LemA family protein [Candidatus Auribacterota bacterium]NLW94552.1 LemA family protein [Chlamydiota bacterium]HOE26396.1 LemA family protein [bacterium]HQM51661.1 LemA family protein [bacterium]
MPIAAAAFVAVAVWAVVAYNRLVRDANLVREAWSGIDVQFRMRYDLVPALVETVKGYRLHERALFEEVAAARARCAGTASIADKGAAESALTRGIRSLFAVAEAYPELKASRNFLDLQKSLTEVEDRIQHARRYYNGTVRDYNIRVESFPGMAVARAARFRRADYFELELATQRDAPGVVL